MIQSVGLTKQFVRTLKKGQKEEFYAVDHISFTANQGEILGVLGPNGAGKTTLLRMLGSLMEPTEGHVVIEDIKGDVVADKAALKKHIGYLSENTKLYGRFTVRETLTLFGELYGFSREEVEKKIQQTNEVLDLDEFIDTLENGIDTYVGERGASLSGGQRQRVALGRAIVRQPKVFLMDEPLSNLDAKLRIQMRAEIKKLHEELKTTFIYVTHDQTEALTMGDRIAIIDKGVIQQTDSPDNIYNKPKNTFVGGFLGAPAMNFISTKIENGQISVNDSGFNLSDVQKKLIGERKEVLLGVRAENMSVENSNFQFNAPITISEMLGSEKVVYFNANGCNCAARLSAKQNVEKTMTFKVNSTDFLFFDKETKEILTV